MNGFRSRTLLFAGAGPELGRRDTTIARELPWLPSPPRSGEMGWGVRGPELSMRSSIAFSIRHPAPGGSRSTYP